MVDSVSADSGEEEPERPYGRDEHDGESAAESDNDNTTSRRRRGKKQKQRSFWKELPILIAVALVLAFLIQYFLARVYMIPSGSMEQTLQINDRILVDKVTYEFSDVEPGDVVVFKGPRSWMPEGSSEGSQNEVVGFLRSVGSVFGLAPPDEKDFVKRVIATGGQTVSCCDADGNVKVDGESLHEPYIHAPAGREQLPRQEFDPVTVPEDKVWVMGDNRGNSCDSRCQGGGGVAGTVPVDNIIGKARLIVLPPSRWSTVGDTNPQQ